MKNYCLIYTDPDSVVQKVEVQGKSANTIAEDFSRVLSNECYMGRIPDVEENDSDAADDYSEACQFICCFEAGCDYQFEGV